MNTCDNCNQVFDETDITIYYDKQYCWDCFEPTVEAASEVDCFTLMAGREHGR